MELQVLVIILQQVHCEYVTLACLRPAIQAVASDAYWIRASLCFLQFMDVALGNDSRHELWSFKANNAEDSRLVSLRNYEQALAAARLNGGRFRQAEATQTGAGWPEQRPQPQNQASCVPIALLCLGHAAYCLACEFCDASVAARAALLFACGALPAAAALSRRQSAKVAANTPKHYERSVQTKRPPL